MHCSTVATVKGNDFSYAHNLTQFYSIESEYHCHSSCMVYDASHIVMRHNMNATASSCMHNGSGVDLGFMEGGLTQGSILLGGGSQHAKRTGTRGPGGMPPHPLHPGKFLKINAILPVDILYYTYHLKISCSSTACVDGKVSVGSGNHIMHPLAIKGKKGLAIEAQHGFTIWP